MWPVTGLQAQDMSLAALKKQMDRKRETMKFLYETQRNVEATCRRVLDGSRVLTRKTSPKQTIFSGEEMTKKQGRMFTQRLTRSVPEIEAQKTIRKYPDSVPNDSIEIVEFSSAVDSSEKPGLSAAEKLTSGEVRFGAKPWENDEFVPSANPGALPTGKRKEVWGIGLVEPVSMEQFAIYQERFENYRPPCEPLGMELGHNGWRLQEKYKQPQLPVDVPFPVLSPSEKPVFERAEAAVRVQQHLLNHI